MCNESVLWNNVVIYNVMGREKIYCVLYRKKEEERS